MPSPQSGKKESSSDHRRVEGTRGIRLRRRSAVITRPPASATSTDPGCGVPQVGRAGERVLDDAPRNHRELVDDAAGGPDLSRPALHGSIEPEGRAERLGQGGQPARDGLRVVGEADWLAPRVGPAALSRVEHHPLGLSRPRDVDRAGHGGAAVEHSYGGREHGQAVHEVLSAVERVEDPYVVGRGTAVDVLVLLADDPVIRVRL